MLQNGPNNVKSCTIKLYSGTKSQFQLALTQPKK